MNPAAKHLGLGGAVCLGLWLCGCGAIGYLGQVLPEDKIPAVYEPADRPTVVFVDDPGGRLASAQLLGVIASRLTHDLKENKVFADPIETQSVDRLRFSEADFERWSIARVGREVGAEQVIYVRIDGFELTDANQMYKPMLWGRVKVVEVSSSDRLFPTDAASGLALNSKMYYKNIDPNQRNDDNVLGRQIADRFGRDLGKLFYDHKPRQVGSGFED